MGHFGFFSIFLFSRNILAWPGSKIAVKFSRLQYGKAASFSPSNDRGITSESFPRRHMKSSSRHTATQNAARVRS
jgi:hypothetical protein